MLVGKHTRTMEHNSCLGFIIKQNGPFVSICTIPNCLVTGISFLMKNRVMIKNGSVSEVVNNAHMMVSSQQSGDTGVQRIDR